MKGIRNRAKRGERAVQNSRFLWDTHSLEEVSGVGVQESVSGGAGVGVQRVRVCEDGGLRRRGVSRRSGRGTRGPMWTCRASSPSPRTHKREGRGCSRPAKRLGDGWRCRNLHHPQPLALPLFRSSESALTHVGGPAAPSHSLQIS